MRLAICDGDKYASNQLGRYLWEYFYRNSMDKPNIITFETGEAMLQYDGPLDLVFMDVEMQGRDGIWVGKELKKKYPDIIIMIVTSYVNYLDEAMRMHVFRYLSKPIEKMRLYQNLKDALLFYFNNNRKVVVETRGFVHTIRARDILCVEAVNRKTVVHTTYQNRQYASIRSMQYWEQQLGDKVFFRTHRSFLVNMEHISDFDHSLIYLHDSDVRAYLTKRKYSEFKHAYLFYLESTKWENDRESY